MKRPILWMFFLVLGVVAGAGGLLLLNGGGREQQRDIQAGDEAPGSRNWVLTEKSPRRDLNDKVSLNVIRTVNSAKQASYLINLSWGSTYQMTPEQAADLIRFYEANKAAKKSSSEIIAEAELWWHGPFSIKYDLAGNKFLWSDSELDAKFFDFLRLGLNEVKKMKATPSSVGW